MRFRGGRDDGANVVNKLDTGGGDGVATTNGAVTEAATGHVGEGGELGGVGGSC